MRNVLYVIGITIVLLCSCHSDPVWLSLEVAESIMEEYPDSALAILENIDGSQLKGEAQALHALLLSQAYDKNYIDVTSDSLISIAWNYYAVSNDKRHRMLASHYKAVVEKNSGSYGLALHDALAAHDDAQRLNDHLNLSRIESVIARLYVMAADYHSAIYWDSIALNHAKAIGKTNWIQNGYNNIGESFVSINRFGDAIMYADSSMAIYPDSPDRALEIKYLSFWGLGQRNLADSILNIMSKDGIELSSSVQATLAHSDIHDPTETIEYLNSKIAEQNDYILAITTNNFAEICRRYELSKEDRLRNELKDKNDRLILLCIIAILLIAGLTMLIFAMRWKSMVEKTKLESGLKDVTLLYKNLQSDVSEREDLKAYAILAFLSRFQWVDKLGNLYLEASTSSDNENRLVNTMKKELHALKPNSLTAEIEDTLKRERQDLWEELSRIKLIPSEKELLIYILCGTSTRVITLLTQKTPASIYSMKNRIKSKLKASGTPLALQILEQI